MGTCEKYLFRPGKFLPASVTASTDLHWAHDTSCPYFSLPYLSVLCLLTTSRETDYEQQRLHLLHKHGIDLEDSNGIADGTRTKRLDRKEVERLMGGGDGQSGVFTWRENLTTASLSASDATFVVAS